MQIEAALFFDRVAGEEAQPRVLRAVRHGFVFRAAALRVKAHRNLRLNRRSIKRSKSFLCIFGDNSETAIYTINHSLIICQDLDQLGFVKQHDRFRQI